MDIERSKYIAAVTLYGTIGLLLHYITLPSEIVVLCRGVIGTLTILLVLFIQKKSFHPDTIRANLPILLLSGACLGLNWVFLFAAYRVTTVAVASLCNYMAPIIVIALSPLVFRERLTKKKLCCILTAFIGIILVSGVFQNGGGNLDLKGVGLGLTAALCFVGIVLCNKKSAGIDPLEKTAIQLAASAAVVLPYVLYNQWGDTLSVDTRSALLVLVLGFVHTGFAYILYFESMAKISIQSVAILGYLEPVVSVLTSALILQEPITASGIMGAVLILGAAVYSETDH